MLLNDDGHGVKGFVFKGFGFYNTNNHENKCVDGKRSYFTEKKAFLVH